MGIDPAGLEAVELRFEATRPRPDLVGVVGGVWGGDGREMQGKDGTVHVLLTMKANNADQDAHCAGRKGKVN